VISRSTISGKYPTQKLGEIVEFLDSRRRPVTESDRRPGPYPYFGANGQLGTIDDFIFDEAIVLLAEDGGHFDDPDRGIAYRISGKTWVNNHAHVLRPTSAIDLGFLCRVLENYDLTPFVTGTTRGKLTKAGAEKIPIPLPPLEEQRRIAAILDAAEALREKRRQSLAKLDTLTQSVFLDIFGDPVANPKEWEKKPVGEIGRVITGNTPPRGKPEYYGNEIEWVKSDNLNTPQAYITKAQEMLSKEGKLISRTVPAGSILVTCIAGSPSCIGNAAITDREVAFNQQINALVPKQADFRFLFAHIVVGKRLIQEASTAGMKGMVSKSRFEKIRLMYPPLNLQRTFAAAFDKIEDLKTAQRSSLEKLDELFRSLQHRAFRGEL
jgi:type I restriction enzyme, S subunit